MLWGKYAQNKAKLINENVHFVMKGVHPSPLAAASGGDFSKVDHFSRTNKILTKRGEEAINWNLK